MSLLKIMDPKKRDHIVEEFLKIQERNGNTPKETVSLLEGVSGTGNTTLFTLEDGFLINALQGVYFIKIHVLLPRDKNY